MSGIFFTSDIHLGHKRIMEFCPTTRGGCTTVEAHDELLITNWNKQVGDSDTVYLLGDISWHKADKTLELLGRLKGHIQLILGNHDKGITKHQHGHIFETIQHYKEVKIAGIDVIMSHYPMARWNKGHHGSYMLFGHEHGAFQNVGRSMDVGVDSRPNGDMTLWSWEEVHDKLKVLPVTEHH